MSTRPETEFKLRATQPLTAADVERRLRELAADVLAEAPRRHVDEYLDDDDGSLAAAGIGQMDGYAAVLGDGGAEAVAAYVWQQAQAGWPRT